MWQAEFRLYLYPDDPVFIASAPDLESRLLDLQFIDRKLENNRYSTGSSFVSLLTFMGCSPNIELEPQENKPFCYIEINTADKPIFISGKNAKKAACLHCKKPLSLQLLKIPENQMSCPNCNQAIDIGKLNWRKSAFIASSWICIGNIYELEAVPNDQLLKALENETGVRWKHAYIRINTH